MVEVGPHMAVEMLTHKSRENNLCCLNHLGPDVFSDNLKEQNRT